MQFSDVSTKQGLIQDISWLLGIDLNGFKIEDRTRSINERYRMIWHMIFDSYGGWKYMDDNLSDATTGVPYADSNIVSGTGLYTLPSGALTIGGVEVKTSATSTFTRLKPVTREEFLDAGGDGAFSSTGVPAYYMLQGDVIVLLPTPNFSTTSGLRVYFGQDISTFASTDTTKTPGFASPFHRMLSIGASLDYAIGKGLAKKNDLQALWNDYEIRLRKFYADRWVDNSPKRLRNNFDIMSLT